jgi:hypothetical protein
MFEHRSDELARVLDDLSLTNDIVIDVMAATSHLVSMILLLSRWSLAAFAG